MNSSRFSLTDMFLGNINIPINMMTELTEQEVEVEVITRFGADLETDK